MALELYAHPLSSCCQKAQIALYEADDAVNLSPLDHTGPQSFFPFNALWPIGKFPLGAPDLGRAGGALPTVREPAPRVSD